MIGRNASHASMRAQLQEARWLLKSLEIRNETLMKVARSHRRAPDRLPRARRGAHAADDPQGHRRRPSTCTSRPSRASPPASTCTRRAACSSCSYFFSSQVEGADGSGTSSTAIRAKIRKLVKEEDADNPLSDSRIAELLSGEGIPVARRTVAKYREAMGIAPSNERKAQVAADVTSRKSRQAKKETAMQLQLTGHHVEVTPSMRGYVEKKLERISRHFDHVIDVHCVLTVEKLDRRPKPPFTSAATPSTPTPPTETCTPPSTC